jgi:hypothetical protein
VISFMPSKESGSNKGFPAILTLKWLFSMFLILVWLLSTVSPEGQTQRWMSDEDFFTHTAFTWLIPVGVLRFTIWSWGWLKTSPHGILSFSPSLLTICLLEIMRCTLLSSYFLMTNKIINSSMLCKKFWTCRMIPEQKLSIQWYHYGY